MKKLILEIARWAVVLIAVIHLALMFAGDPISNADPAAVETAVTSVLDMSQVLEGDNQMIKRLYGLDPGSFEACILYYPGTNMVAEELLIVKLADTAQQEQVRAAIDARLQTQKTTFDGYGVEQYDLLTNHAVVEIRGNWVLFAVHTDAEAALQAFLDAL
ncbi:MAG: DUF4358 domain-containing protein [Oscillospiraceae bacterium]|nr:DUF4358 domain-containing protein [Oscillospiraceae bacterium]